MQLEVPANPNCGPSDQFVFQELGPPKRVQGILVISAPAKRTGPSSGGEGRTRPASAGEERGKEVRCDVVGVEEGGRFVEARATKIADSGAGYAYLITGGAWGIRLRPAPHAREPWDLSNRHQWGEPFKIYGEEDIIYGV